MLTLMHCLRCFCVALLILWLYVATIFDCARRLTRQIQNSWMLAQIQNSRMFVISDNSWKSNSLRRYGQVAPLPPVCMSNLVGHMFNLLHNSLLGPARVAVYMFTLIGRMLKRHTINTFIVLLSQCGTTYWLLQVMVSIYKHIVLAHKFPLVPKLG